MLFKNTSRLSGVKILTSCGSSHPVAGLLTKKNISKTKEEQEFINLVREFINLVREFINLVREFSVTKSTMLLKIAIVKNSVDYLELKNLQNLFTF